jgi:hypothetical protein
MTATPTKPRRGAPLADPEAGKRNSITLRVHPDTVRRLKAGSKIRSMSQARLVDWAIAELLR